MSFETIGFAASFDEAFRLDSTALVTHLAIENRIRPYVEKVLLARLAVASVPIARPRVTKAEVEERFDRIRLELDYPEAERTRQLLEECCVTLDVMDESVRVRLQLEKVVDRFIAGIWRDRSRRDAICTEAFLDLDLRGHLVHAVSVGLLGRPYGPSPARGVDEGAEARIGQPEPTDSATSAARRHLLLRHGLTEWSDLIDKLQRVWGVEVERIEQFVLTYAAALETTSQRWPTNTAASMVAVRESTTGQWRLRKAGESSDRVVPAAQTVQRLMARREHYGITRVTDVTGLDDLGIPVHCAFRPRSVSASTVHSGKGLTATESLASALAEAVECDCGERFRPGDRVRGTLAEVRRDHAVADLPPHAVPGGRGIPEGLVLEWVFVEDMLAAASGARHVLLPLEFIQQGRAHADTRALFPVTMSQGLASGNIAEEAVNHALCELIERDAVAIFTFRARYLREDLRRHYRRIDLRGLPDRVQALIDKIRTANRRVALIDVTTNVGLPVVICRISSPNGTHCGGFGASLSAERAVVRAITEAAQTSTANIQGAREDLALGSRDPRIHERTFGLESARARELFDDPAVAEIPFASLLSRVHEYVDQDLDALLESLRSAGISHAYVCDVSDAACADFRVVRAVVPELERTRLDCIGPRRLRCALSV